MSRNLFSRSSSRQAHQAHSPSIQEHVSSSPPQRKPPLPASDQSSLSETEDNFLKSSLPRWSSPSMKSKSEINLPGKKNTWSSISGMLSRNHSSTQGSSGTDNGYLERPSTLGTNTHGEVELHISPPSSPAADPSTGRSRGPGTKTKSNLLSQLRKEKPSEPAHKIEACEGELVASRHKIGDASIDCEFYKIEYGQFKETPACLIIVDVRLVYPPDDTIDRVKLELQFVKDVAQNFTPGNPDCAQDTKAPISKVFAPENLEGIPSHSQKTSHHNIKPKVAGLSFKIDTGEGGSQTTSTKEHRWRVLGRREEHNGIYDTFGWNIFQNQVSEDSVPRQVRLGMIVFHEHEPFSVNVNIEGSTRQKHWRSKATHERRWFNPPSSEDVGRHILQEAMVENLVSKQNLLIRDIAPSRVMEYKTVNLIDLADIGGGAGSGIDGGGMITDLLSVGDDALAVESPTSF